MSFIGRRFPCCNYILQFLYSDLPCTPEIWWFLSCALERDSWVFLILVKAYQLHFFDRRGHRPMFLEKRSLLVNENFWSSDITPRFHWNFLPCWTLKYPILSSPLFRSFTLLSLCKEEETTWSWHLVINQRKIKNLQNHLNTNTFNVPLGFSFSRLDVYLHHVDNRIPCDLPRQMGRDQMADDYPPIIPCVF